MYNRFLQFIFPSRFKSIALIDAFSSAFMTRETVLPCGHGMHMSAVGVVENCYRTVTACSEARSIRWAFLWHFGNNVHCLLYYNDFIICDLSTTKHCAFYGEDQYCSIFSVSICYIFTARRNARIAGDVPATAIQSVCLSVRLFVRPSITRRYCLKTTARSTVQFALSDSKMCLVL